MKLVKFLLPLLLLCAILFCGCTGKEEKKIGEVVKRELDLLKHLDSDTTEKYISYQEIFPGDIEDASKSSEVDEVFSLFFQDFDYKILDTSISRDRKSAQVDLRLITLDARALAEDFSRVQLRNEIALTASDNEDEDQTVTLADRYALLNQLLSSNKYSTVEHNCTLSLTSSTKDGETVWEIKRTYTLENDLVGGLMNYLTDPDILSPEDTLLVYLDTLKNMSAKELSNYLNTDSIVNTEDSDKIKLANTLVEQIHNVFDYNIGEASVSGYHASVKAAITTFDSEAILSNYQSQLDEYLSSADAVIDGAQKRYDKSYKLLLDSIEANEKVKTVSATFNLINDGASWKLEDAGTVFGQALFGTLNSSPVEDNEQAS